MARSSILILHPSALVRQWLAAVARSSDIFTSIIVSASLDIAVSKFEPYTHGILCIDESYLDEKSRAWIRDRRQRKDEQLMVLFASERVRKQDSAFRLPDVLQTQNLEDCSMRLREQLRRLASRPVKDVLEESGVPMPQPGTRLFIVPEEKLHPDAVLPFRNLTGPMAREGIIVCGSSTGGTEALYRMLKSMPADLPPVCMVQHMPLSFIEDFAKNLSRRIGRRVELAQEGIVPLRGHLYLMPGGAQWAFSVRGSGPPALYAIDPRPVTRHLPSADILLRSAAMCFGRYSCGILLTGMGDDGVTGMGDIFRQGGSCLIQSESDCVVFGMPGEARKRGFVHAELPASEIPFELQRIFSPSP